MHRPIKTLCGSGRLTHRLLLSDKQNLILLSGQPQIVTHLDISRTLAYFSSSYLCVVQFAGTRCSLVELPDASCEA